MTKRHQRTLEAIREKPTRANVRWTDAMALLRSLGAEIDEKRAGARVAIALKDRVGVLHRPHPGNEMKKRSVEALRKLLDEAGV